MRKLGGLLCLLILATAAGAQTNMALPAGTAFKVKLEKTLSTFSSKEGDSFSGRVTQDVVLDKNRDSRRGDSARSGHESQ